MTHIDLSILLWIQEHLRFAWATPIWKAITMLGNSGIFWVLLALVLVIRKDTRFAGLTAGLSLLFDVTVVNLLLKNLIGRIRPYEICSSLIPLIAKPHDYSFPSGHTAASFAAAIVLIRLLPRRYGIPAVVLAVLISLSRLYLGVHYPSDVIGGAVIGTLCALAACLITERIRRSKEASS